MQINMTPFHGACDFSLLAGISPDAPIDLVSIADLMRNGFVYPPHSIFENVKLVTSSFDPSQDMHAAPTPRFMFREGARGRRQERADQDWVGHYHRLLCNAVLASCGGMRAPWLLQSAGKDSTSIAIAAAEVRPDAVCITYLGGTEENEIVSARAIAGTLGLRHEALECDPGRAYDRYLAVVDRMPLLTADFALLSYVDVATEVRRGGGDGVIDGIGSDNYFGHMVEWKYRWLSRLARRLHLPRRAAELPIVGHSFPLCYVLSTLQMHPIERAFPGSRFTDAEVDALCGRTVSSLSRARLAPFQAEMDSAASMDEWWAMASSIAGSAAVGKGLYATAALSLAVAYPFCDRALREWVFNEVPHDMLVDPVGHVGKVLMRKHIATRFGYLPYVANKGSFRFDVCGLARSRFEQVHAFARAQADLLPGAAAWLEHNRERFDNKYHASKFYLLAVLLPWLASHAQESN
jgi:asparagine synthetase B (glutamine-hydrolysing)